MELRAMGIRRSCPFGYRGALNRENSYSKLTLEFTVNVILKNGVVTGFACNSRFIIKAMMQ